MVIREKVKIKRIAFYSAKGKMAYTMVRIIPFRVRMSMAWRRCLSDIDTVCAAFYSGI